MMSRSFRAIATVLGFTLVVVAQPSRAADADVERQMREMQTRMQQMEDKLQAASDELDSANQRVDEQAQLIEKAGLRNTRGSSNGLPGFLGEITIGGWVQASYLYSINDPNDSDFDDGLGPDPGDGGLGGTLSGANGALYPYTPDHNSFALDQVWFEIERPVSEEHRAGFRFEPVYGKTAAMIGGPSNRRDGIRDDTALYIFSGYVQYLAPIGDGLTFKMGKFGTPIGNEYAQAIYNWNITHGNVFQLLEPLDHIGITAEYEFGDSGFDAMVGGVNGFFPDDPDRNDAKSVIGHVGWSNDTISFGVNGIYGSENQGHDGGESGVVNGVLNVELSDRLAFWINGDYAWLQESDQAAWGVASAIRFGITDRTGIALRGEYVADVDDYLGFAGFDDETGAITGFNGVEIWSATATIDHLLTDNLKVRAEVRYDTINKDDTDNAEFFEDSNELDDDQVVVGADVIYNFNKFGGE
jgi:hypothetical protein